MQSNKNFFVPEYIQDFRCIGKDCIDSCCVGWNINIDKETYKKYKNSDNNEIKSISKKFLVKNDLNSNINYAKLVNQNNCCPFLNKDKLCNAFNLLGQKNLSIGCATYPRQIKIFDKIGFIAGSLSCPEIARLCLSRQNLKIKKKNINKLVNIFNSHKVFSAQTRKKIRNKKLQFMREVFSIINDNFTFFDTLKETIFAYEKKSNSKILINYFSKNQMEKIKKDLLIYDTNILATLCFSKLASGNKQADQSSIKIAESKNIVDSRFKKICKEAAIQSDYLFSPKTDFIGEFSYIYNTKFERFRRKNDFIFKNYFVNEFLKNIESLLNSVSAFDNFIREIIFFITLTNFLCVCQLFDGKKKLTINRYAEVLSAVQKSVNHSSEKNAQLIGIFRKIDKDDMFKRLVSLY